MSSQWTTVRRTTKAQGSGPCTKKNSKAVHFAPDAKLVEPVKLNVPVKHNGPVKSYVLYVSIKQTEEPRRECEMSLEARRAILEEKHSLQGAWRKVDYENKQRLLMPSVQVIECWWKRETALRRWHQAVDAAMRTAAELRALRAAMEEKMKKDAAARTVQRAWHVRQERKQRMVASRWQQMVMQAVKARAAAEHVKACALLERALKRFYIGRRWVAVLDAAQTAAYEARVKRQAKAERRRARRVAAKVAEMEALETRLRHANTIACVLVTGAGATVGRNVATGTVGRDLASLRLRGGGTGDRVLRSRGSSKAVVESSDDGSSDEFEPSDSSNSEGDGGLTVSQDGKGRRTGARLSLGAPSAGAAGMFPCRRRGLAPATPSSRGARR